MLYQRVLSWWAMFDADHRPFAVDDGSIFSCTISRAANLQQRLAATRARDLVLGHDGFPKDAPVLSRAVGGEAGVAGVGPTSANLGFFVTINFLARMF